MPDNDQTAPSPADQDDDLIATIDAIAHNGVNNGVEKSLEKFLNDAEFQAILVREICEKYDDLNPRLVRFVLKRATPLIIKSTGKSIGWLGKITQQRLIKILKSTPGYDQVMTALDQVLAKADLTQRAEHELAAIREGKLQRNEAEHLDFLSSDLKRHAEILDELDDIKVALDNLRNPQPKLNLEIVKDHREQRRFFYGTRYVEFQGRQDELAQLDAFLNSERMVSWHLITGSGGQGKSRLALEFCLQVGGAWRTGFLGTHTSFASWEDWLPDQPTLIVVDYVARRGETVGKAIRHAAANQNNFEFPVRFLLLERDMPSDAEWVKNFWGTGGSEQFRLEDARHQEQALTLSDPGPDELWTIMQGMNTDLDKSRRDECLEKLSTIDTETRALYAAFLGEALTEYEDALNWDTTTLSKNILHRDQDNFWPDGDIHKDKNLLALATMTGGVPLDVLDAVHGTNLMPTPDDEAVFDRQLLMSGRASDDQFLPLEPDILGELFVLETLRIPALKRPHEIKRHDNLRTLAWHYEPKGMLNFLEHCARDFPSHETLKTLSLPLNDPNIHPINIANSMLAITSTAGHLWRAGEVELLIKHAQALCQAFQNNAHASIRNGAALATPPLYQALEETGQFRSAEELSDGLSRLADKYPDETLIQAPKAIVMIKLMLSEMRHGTPANAQAFLDEAVAIARRFPDHTYTQIILNAYADYQKTIEDFSQIHSKNQDTISAAFDQVLANKPKAP